ncbi:penicillin-binding protein [Nocardioides gansuensis]|uniref:Beta-lactamase n=1 Tax=Nocardioides gansuensis TaxID=2138300 RepID=A0A2T8FEZ2_9ACTN|nr:penicillin-binding transpeptidase domain-containing protein [Nocardioides gansuensis]PVG84276.1 penicillin-binding protein [Nocardioides gansuensis]
MQIRTGPVTILLATGLVAATLAGCTQGEGPEPTVERLAAALETGDLAPLGAEIEAAAAEEYAAILEPLGDELRPTVVVGEVTSEDDTAEAQLRWTWDLGDEERWTYASAADLTRTEDTWQVQWSPSLVEPSLQAGEQLDVDTVTAERGDILGSGDQPLVTARDVARLGLDKTRVKAGQVASSARRIAELLDIDVAAYVARAEAAGAEAFVEALVLRADEAAEVSPEFARVPGAFVVNDQLPLGPTRGFAAPILGSVGEATAEIIEKSGGRVAAGDEVGISGLQARYDEQLAGTPGVRVEAVLEDAERTLHEVAPTSGTPLRTTLDPHLQTRAEALLADVGPASAIVAIRPSDGALLAAASGPGGGGLNTATYGQYAPGSTFKVVSTLALLRAGLQPATEVECPPTTVVDGKSFKNYDDYPSSALGTISLRMALANSCNTAFIGSRDRLREGDLADAAAALGLGVDHDLGFPAYFGQVPPPEGETEAAADLIGQGKVLASPMAMAAVAASVSAGRAVLPVLLPDHTAEQQPPAKPLTEGEAVALRSLLRAVVTEGSGVGLADLGEVIAKTGTAEYGEAPSGQAGDGELPTHAWMIAARGDLAVSVFVETGESGSRTAGPILEAFLR